MALSASDGLPKPVVRPANRSSPRVGKAVVALLSITVSAVNTGQSSTSRRTRDRSNRIRRAAPTTPQEVGDVDLSHTDESVEPESPELAVPMLTAPTDGLPELVTDAASVKAAAASLQDGDGPIAIDAERAGGYRYDNRAYLIQLRRQGAGTVLIDRSICRPTTSPHLRRCCRKTNGFCMPPVRTFLVWQSSDLRLRPRCCSTQRWRHESPVVRGWG